MFNKRKFNLVDLVFIILFVIVLIGPVLSGAIESLSGKVEEFKTSSSFNLLCSKTFKEMENDLKKFSKKNGINLNITYVDDLEVVDILNTDYKSYDGVWIANSIWFYMLDNGSIITDSKSVAIDPVIMGVTHSKASELGLIRDNVTNNDLLEAVSSGKLHYVMTSVTQTNTGATAFLGFLNSLAGSPDVLTESIIHDSSLVGKMSTFFKGVDRVSGDEDYLTEMYLNGKYNAMINYESSFINLNKRLVSEGKEPLYLIYPQDGVALNDMPLAYVSHGQDSKKREFFLEMQSYIRSDEVSLLMQEKGFRTWFGGVNDNVNKEIFNPDWGIKTGNYLKSFKYPSKKVMTEAFNLYIDAIRKPTHVVFLFDVSGSMYGEGINELRDAMTYLLDKEATKADMLQFSEADKITFISFNYDVLKVYDTLSGSETDKLTEYLDTLNPVGGTNIYSPSIEALRILRQVSSNDYTKTIILMTDGYSNNGTYQELEDYYHKYDLDIPIYSITFGSSSESQLNRIASLTNGKVFDGKNGLKAAFKEVRSYN